MTQHSFLNPPPPVLYFEFFFKSSYSTGFFRLSCTFSSSGNFLDGMPGGDGRRRDGAVRPNELDRRVARVSGAAPASDAKNSIGTFVRPRWSINQHQSRGKKAAGPTVTRGGLPHAQSRNPVHESSSVLLSYPSFGYFLRGLRTRRAPAVTVGRNFVVVVVVVVVRSGIPFATELASFYPPLISFPGSEWFFCSFVRSTFPLFL